MARKWQTQVYSRDFAGGFAFHTFREAINYAKQIQTLSRREDPNGLTPFRAEITGPGGLMTFETIRVLLN